MRRLLQITILFSQAWNAPCIVSNYEYCVKIKIQSSAIAHRFLTLDN